MSHSRTLDRPVSSGLSLLAWWRRWSPRATVRLDADKDHSYRSSSWPISLSDIPTASYLADRSGVFQLLAFDFDVGRYGRDAVDADASVMAGVLEELGVPHLTVRSGPAGGIHVWVRLQSGADAQSVAALARAIRSHLPTLDITPLCNPATGAVRIPGSAHRAGGCAEPLLRADDLDVALLAMDRDAPPVEVVDWLHARFPTRLTPREHTPHKALGISTTGSGPAQRLDRVRTPLTGGTAQLLNDPLKASCDRSSVAWRVLLGMAASGWCWTDVVGQIRRPGLTRLREDYESNPGRAIKQWHKALAVAAQTAWPRTAPYEVSDDSVSGAIAEAESALLRSPARWSAPGGASAERVLCAFLSVCISAHSTTINIDVRRLAEGANVHAATACRALHRLQAQGWITRTAEAEGTCSATWRLNRPPLSTAATQVESRPYGSGLTERLQHAQRDVWVWNGGLGGAAEQIHHAWGLGVGTVDDVVRRTGYGRGVVSRWLDRMQRLGLLVEWPNWTLSSQLLDVVGVMTRRIHRHRWERAVRDWWNQEVAWRKRRGKQRKRGPRPAEIYPAAIALPIAAPERVRYGRFPTNAKGRMAYGRALDWVALRDSLSVA